MYARCSPLGLGAWGGFQVADNPTTRGASFGEKRNSVGKQSSSLSFGEGRGEALYKETPGNVLFKLNNEQRTAEFSGAGKDERSLSWSGG